MNEPRPYIGRRSLNLRNCDVFAAVNMVLFLVMGAVVYLQRFLVYRGPGNLNEFFVYACAIGAVILVAWISLRQTNYPTRLYVVTQAGLLAHFAGAFVSIGGVRLYDTQILGLGYDKYVHLFNAAVGAALIAHLFEAVAVRPWLKAIILLMIVLGAGAVVEILEFMVTLTIPNAGVGDYNNNMGDLVANGLGATIYLATTGAIDQIRHVRERAHPA